MKALRAVAGFAVLWGALLCVAQAHLPACAEPPGASEVLARADAAYRQERWAYAAQLYRRVHREDWAPSRQDEILFRIGYCSEKSIRELVALVDPARFSSANYDDAERLRPFLDWFRKERGYYPQGSEGSWVWRYDGGAYRELLESHPGSVYADDAALKLVRIDFLMHHNPAIFFARDSEGRVAARDVIAAYEKVLSRYPATDRRRECEELISVWNTYLERGTLPFDWMWVQD